MHAVFSCHIKYDTGDNNEICMHAVDNDMAKPLGNIIIVISINAIISLHLLKEEDACKFL